MTVLTAADSILRLRRLETPRRSASLILIVIAFGFTYGAAMGLFGGIAGERLLQILYSALKVPLLLLATLAVALPSFFVLNTLAGIGNDFPEAVRALATGQAALTIILASLSPLTLLWYASSTSYESAQLFNALMFAVAAVSAHRVVKRLYAGLIRRDARHRMLLRVWLILFGFVGIQMSWVLRPFVGAPWARVQFFRHDAWGNAYEVLFRTVWHVVGR